MTNERIDAYAVLEAQRETMSSSACSRRQQRALVGHARDARCVTPAKTRAIVHLDDTDHAYLAYRVTPCSGNNSFFALAGAHPNVDWIQPTVADIASSQKNVRAEQVTMPGVDADITSMMTVHREKRCTRALGFSVSITSKDGSMLDLADAQVRGGVVVNKTAILFFVDPRSPNVVQGARVAGGHVEHLFKVTVDNNQDGVDCIRS